jgi:hypothetical protein
LRPSKVTKSRKKIRTEKKQTAGLQRESKDRLTSRAACEEAKLNLAIGFSKILAELRLSSNQ